MLPSIRTLSWSTLAVLLVLSLPAATAARPSVSATTVGLVTHDLATGGETPTSLVQELVGPGAVVSNIVYNGAPVAAGTFTGGTGIVGFERGILLSTGDVVEVVGPTNDSDETSIDYGTPGDADLLALIGNGTMENACILEFDLDCPTGSVISFQYVYGSEEYEDSVAATFNDVFGCFLNGQNIAWVPGTNDPVALGFVNCGYPYDPPGGANCAYYVTNNCTTLGLGWPCTATVATEIDGLSGVFTATGTLLPGTNHVKLAIADHLDGNFDSYVFLRGQSFICASTPPVFGAATPGGQVLRALAGVPMSFDVSASAANGLPGESVALSVAGDPAPLAGGTFTPALPTGLSQPASTRFDWTPTAGDLGIHHLDFTVTDQLLESASCNVAILVSQSAPPAFFPPSPCGQVLNAWTGTPFGFAVAASGQNGLSNETITLDVSGDPVPIAGGTFVPALPAGPAPSVTTQFSWNPVPADAGIHQLVFTATDQLQGTSTCTVTIRVHDSPGINHCQPGVAGTLYCPCNNPPANAPRGCNNSSHTGGARLTSDGVASIANDTVVFTTDGERPTATSILFQGNVHWSQGVLYGQGVRCALGLIKRLYVKTAAAGSITAPQPGDPSVHARSESRGDPIQAGESRYYAVYYRDPTIPFPCDSSRNFNITQMQEVLWGP